MEKVIRKDGIVGVDFTKKKRPHYKSLNAYHESQVKVLRRQVWLWFWIALVLFIGWLVFWISFWLTFF